MKRIDFRITLGVLMAGLCLFIPVFILRRNPATELRPIRFSGKSNVRNDRSLHPQTKANFLTGLRGPQVLAGVSFDIDGLIALAGRHTRGLGGDYPEDVRDVAVGVRCRAIHFLLGTGWEAADGTPIATLTFRYASGQRLDLSLVYGVQVRNWWDDGKDNSKTSEAVVAWRGRNGEADAAGCSLRLYSWTWTNPRPSDVLIAMDLKSAMTDCAPFLAAISADVMVR